jgi:hypothetical protein
MMATAPKTATSKDGSAQQQRRRQPHVGKLVSLRRNSGKDAAVKTGMNVSTGLYRLMVDADGATDFGPGLQNLIDAIEKKKQQQEQEQGNESNTNHTNKMMVAFGSRAHLQDRSTAQRSFVRTLLMTAFHFFVLFLCRFWYRQRYTTRSVGLSYSPRIPHWLYSTRYTCNAGRSIPKSSYCVTNTTYPSLRSACRGRK